jgi:FAD/FMN-containing dehydrogenase
MKKLKWVLLLVFLLLVVLYCYHAYTQPEQSSDWPKLNDWKSLNKEVQGRLIQLKSPLYEHCGNTSDSACVSLINKLQNPFVIQEYPWATQSTGWLNAWSAAVSPYAIATQNTNDIVAAIKFAKKHHLKLVTKGTGHDYLGRSTAPHSLLIWTHHMRDVTVQDAFVPKGAPAETMGVHAVTVQAGARWIEVYEEVTTKHGRYVQGGGCTTVGAIGGFLQGGGFGSFSKKYGIAAGNLLEAEVVIASGEVLIANKYQNTDLFWALKGGGGGTFGIVSKATLQTHALPNYFGILQGKITANTDEAFENLLEYFINFYRENLNNEHWGEQVRLKPENSLDLSLLFQGLSEKEVEDVWKPFNQWLEERNNLYTITLSYFTFPANKLWDYDYIATHYSNSIKPYLEGKNKLFYWPDNQTEVLAYWYTYQSCWLPIALFDKDAAKAFAHTLFKASRHWEFSLHFNKGLAGASAEALKSAQDTSINPIVIDSAALAIFGASAQNVFPGMPNHEPDIEKGLEQIQKVNAAVKIMTDFIPDSGSYSNETNYFQQNWQHAFWGRHYTRLLEIKQKYDPDGFFRCHHSVGSELLIKK